MSAKLVLSTVLLLTCQPTVLSTVLIPTCQPTVLLIAVGVIPTCLPTLLHTVVLIKLCYY